MSLLPEQIHEVLIERVIAGGRGLARIDTCAVFVDGVVPGDTASVRITAVHRGYAEAACVDILQPSADRVTPRCPVFGVCGGCQWQHFSYAAQVRWKQEILREQLQRIAKIAEPVLLDPVAADDPWQYRSRIQLNIDDAGRVGFYRQGTHDVVEFDACAIADARINAQLPAAREQLRTTGNGRHVGVDASNGFTQVNIAQNLKMQSLVAEGVRAHGGGTVLELYCGNGNLSLPLAAHATRVIAADDHAGAIAQAKISAQLLQYAHVEFRCTAAKALAAAVQRESLAIDGVILDPPRRGAAEVIDIITNLRPKYIGYVSCDPATLARDLRALIARGYRHESSQLIDMFPQTHHIESVTWVVATSA